MATLKDPDNHLLLERDMKYAFWQNHAIVDAAIGTFIEYGTTDRDKDKESYAEMWHRWIFKDYYRTYMLPLEKYGIKIHHDDVQEAWNRLTKKMYVHTVAPVLRGRLAGQLLADRGPDRQGLRVVRAEVPGLVREVRRVLEVVRQAQPQGRDGDHLQPGRRLRLSAPVLELPGACLIREDVVVDEIDGKLHTFAHELDRWTAVEGFADEYQGRPTPAMGRFSGKREWETLYHGWDLADAIKDLELRPRRRQDPDPAAASALRRQGDVDPGRCPRPHAHVAADSCCAR